MMYQLTLGLSFLNSAMHNWVYYHCNRLHGVRSGRKIAYDEVISLPMVYGHIGGYPHQIFCRDFACGTYVEMC